MQGRFTVELVAGPWFEQADQLGGKPRLVRQMLL